MSISDPLNMDYYNTVADAISGTLSPFDKDPIDGCYNAFGIRQQRMIEFGSNPKNPEQLSMVAEEGRAWLRTGERSIYEVGGLAVIVKEILLYGKFQDWVKKEWCLSTETVDNYMNVYRVCFGRYELVHKFKRGSLLVEICRPRFPEKLRELMLERGEPDATIKEVWEFAKEFKEGKYGLDDLIVKEWYKYQEDRGDYERFEQEKADHIADLKKLLRTVNNMPKGSEWPTYKDKVSCTAKEAANLENLIKELHSCIDELTPDIEVADDEPKFEAEM
jgi:hypothetical protein